MKCGHKICSVWYCTYERGHYAPYHSYIFVQFTEPLVRRLLQVNSLFSVRKMMSSCKLVVRRSAALKVPASVIRCASTETLTVIIKNPLLFPLFNEGSDVMRAKPYIGTLQNIKKSSESSACKYFNWTWNMNSHVDCISEKYMVTLSVPIC